MPRFGSLNRVKIYRKLLRGTEMQPDGIWCNLCYLYAVVCLSVHVGVEPRSPSAYQRSPCVLANLRRRSGGVHVAEEVLDPPEGHATTRVTHLQMEHFVFSTLVVVGLDCWQECC